MFDRVLAARDAFDQSRPSLPRRRHDNGKTIFDDVDRELLTHGERAVCLSGDVPRGGMGATRAAEVQVDRVVSAHVTHEMNGVVLGELGDLRRPELRAPDDTKAIRRGARELDHFDRPLDTPAQGRVIMGAGPA